MIRVILIIVIIIIVYKIYLIKSAEVSVNAENSVNSVNSENSETFINITNPFVSGLSQFQLGSINPDKSQILVDMDYSDTDYTINPNNVLTRPNRNNQTNRNNRIGKVANNTRSPKIQNDIKLISSLRKQKNSCGINENELDIDIDIDIESDDRYNFEVNKNNKYNKNNKNNKYNKNNKIELVNKPCNTLNKFFVETQFNDAYRDVMTAINIICPDQKILFNLQSLPVTTTLYDTTKRLPFSILKLVNQFIIKLNDSIKSLPESGDILNNFNNYLPLTADLKKYVDNKGINKFYKDIGVDFNLYADTPPNAPVEFIKIVEARREFTEAETKYIITFAIKKVLQSVSDQMRLSVHFVIKNDPLSGENMFDKIISPGLSQQVAIEFIFIDGYYTSDYNVDYDCYGAENNTKKISMTDGADNFYSFDALGKDTMLNDNDIIKQLNSKYREHEIEMANFNVNIPYPIYQTPTDSKTPKFY
jgi:hypothetical protein